MIAHLACCTPENTVQEAAEMVVRHDCGEIAIVESNEELKPIGVITDRDITWRVVATGKSPGKLMCGMPCKPKVTRELFMIG